MSSLSSFAQRSSLRSGRGEGLFSRPHGFFDRSGIKRTSSSRTVGSSFALEVLDPRLFKRRKKVSVSPGCRLDLRLASMCTYYWCWESGVDGVEGIARELDYRGRLDLIPLLFSQLFCQYAFVVNYVSLIPSISVDLEAIQPLRHGSVSRSVTFFFLPPFFSIFNLSHCITFVMRRTTRD